jgi:hypothetical protein
MYVLTYFVFDPIVRVVEGSNHGNDEKQGSEVHKFKVKDVQMFEGPTAPLNGVLLEPSSGDISTRHLKTDFIDGVPQPVCNPPCTEKGSVCVYGFGGNHYCT